MPTRWATFKATLPKMQMNWILKFKLRRYLTSHSKWKRKSKRRWNKTRKGKKGKGSLPHRWWRYKMMKIFLLSPQNKMEKTTDEAYLYNSYVRAQLVRVSNLQTRIRSIR